MDIAIVTPAPRHSKQGNRVTALRWAGILRALGHRVRFRGHPDPPLTPSLVVALHAAKSRAAIQSAAERDIPVIVALTGTDVYGNLPTESLEAAWRIVVLQPHALTNLSEPHRRKARVIYQSLTPFPNHPPSNTFHVAVVGHLRPVKDPFRAADAVKLLPPRSRIRIRHIGRALTEDMGRHAVRENRENPRYRWLGELPRRAVRAQLSDCQGIVLSSRSEGGANVVTEAIVGGIPLLTARIPGTVGLLGESYRGYFEVGATEELSHLLLRLEEEPDFRAELVRHMTRLRPLFTPKRERLSWQKLLAELQG